MSEPPAPGQDTPADRHAELLAHYAALEPGESDTWNPLVREVELEHRVQLLRRLTWGLREAGVDAEHLAVLDVGCGNGRSTRMYLELGLLPGQLTGLDPRAGALRRAAASHPAIRWLHDNGGPWSLRPDSIDWASLCTVFSSAAPGPARRELADNVTRVVRPGGHIFVWDRTHALDFAGGDALHPAEWLQAFAPCWESSAVVTGYGPRGDPAPTHHAWLLRRR